MTMSTRERIQHVPRDVVEHNRRLEQLLERKNVTLAAYKTIEALAELAVVALAFYAMYVGADPMLVFGLTSVVVGGWKVVEFLAVYADEIDRALDAAGDVDDGDS